MWGLLSLASKEELEILTKVGACRTSIEDNGEVIDAAELFLSSWYESVSQKGVEDHIGCFPPIALRRKVSHGVCSCQVL
jgi:hypothetical protein